MLQKFEELFDGTLGTWKIGPLGFELREYAKPICSIPYPVPKVHKIIFQNELDNLVHLGFLEIENESE